VLGALLLPTGAMPGASKQSRRVKIVNANWVAGSDGDDGRFEIQIVTEDDQAHVATPSATAMTALIALSQAGAVWSGILPIAP
jgi:hypothetical protein